MILEKEAVIRTHNKFIEEFTWFIKKKQMNREIEIERERYGSSIQQHWMR